jgi:hypothetical protein
VQFPINIGLRRPVSLVLLICVLAMAGVSAVVSVGWSLPVRLGLVIGLTLAATYGAYGLRPSLHSLRIDADGKISVQVARGDAVLPVVLNPGSVVHPWLTVLHLGNAARNWVVVLTPDCVASEPFRRLRVCLRRPGGFSGKPGGS